MLVSLVCSVLLFFIVTVSLLGIQVYMSSFVFVYTIFGARVYVITALFVPLIYLVFYFG